MSPWSLLQAQINVEIQCFISRTHIYGIAVERRVIIVYFYERNSRQAT